MSSYKQKKEDERRKLATKKDGWNSSHVRSDTVVDALASRYGLNSSDIMDTTVAGGEMAVRLAIGEVQVIQENTEYFTAHGVNLSALESHFSGVQRVERSTTTILIKNLPHDVDESELESMFSRFGSLGSFLIPQSKAVALIDFIEPRDARAAFSSLAYRKYKHLPLYLEWAPVGVISRQKSIESEGNGKKSFSTHMDSQSQSNMNMLINENQNSKGVESTYNNFESQENDFGTIFIKNLNFSTTESGMRQHLSRIGCPLNSVRAISFPKKKKSDLMLSQGFGFIEFKSLEDANKALKKLHGSLLDSHALEAKVFNFSALHLQHIIRKILIIFFPFTRLLKNESPVKR